MQLSAHKLIISLTEGLKLERKKLKHQPGLALVFVGEDEQTAAFIRAKQRLAKELDCAFWLHQFPVTASERQLAALIQGLSDKKEVDGLVLQLPLPKSVDTEGLINLINPAKDIDNLRGDSPYPSPTPSGIIALLRYHKIVIKDRQTVILGAGKLVGGPLFQMFTNNNWPVISIERQAEKQVNQIRNGDLLIAATGRPGLVTKEMVHSKMVVVDGSGVDASVETIEPLVEAVTPTKGAIGPLTVRYLFANLLRASHLNDKAK